MAAGRGAVETGQAMRASRRAVLVAALVACVAACAPEVGSARWCEAMREKPRGDWTANEALEFARSCVF
jgi:hypothetical protein